MTNEDKIKEFENKNKIVFPPKFRKFLLNNITYLPSSIDKKQR